ncbi:MAG TPA: hypothetical protein VNZ24_04700 [Vicinamibacterales bacterium]|nr:hypothetical protein [Vicinamibacterales bacterium]
MTATGAVSELRFPRITLFAVFAVLAVVHTWPLASAPSYYSRLDTADAQLNTWAMAWVARTLPTDPRHLFDAGIFFPEQRTLAYSEPLIVQGALAIPVLRLGGSPVLAYNLVLMAGFALTGWAAGLLALRMTGSLLAAIVGGSIAAFNAQSLVRLPHIQAQHLEFLPLALYAFDRLLEHGRPKHAVLLGAAVAFQAFASIYALIFAAWALVCAAAGRAKELLGVDRRRNAVLLLGAMGVAALLLTPVLLPYYQLSKEYGMTRSVAESRQFASTWTDYFYTGGRLHYWLWSHAFQKSAEANFPGVVALALAVIGIVAAKHAQAITRRHVAMAGAIVVGGVLLSVAPWLPGFTWAHANLPALGAIRAYARAGQIVMIGLGLLAAAGAIALRGRWISDRTWPVVAVALVILVNAEALRAPMWYSPFEGIPSIYDVLQGSDHTAVLELPIYGRPGVSRNARYMVNATRHWKPLVNGYSGFVPPDYGVTVRTLNGFPDAASFEWLRSKGVTTMVLHRSDFQRRKGKHQLALVERSPDLEPRASVGDITIYLIREQPH